MIITDLKFIVSGDQAQVLEYNIDLTMTLPFSVVSVHPNDLIPLLHIGLSVALSAQSKE